MLCEHYKVCILFFHEVLQRNKLTGCMFDLHTPDGILKISLITKNTVLGHAAELTLQMPNRSPWDLEDTELAAKDDLR